jgi:hypothetical protein
MIRKLCLITAIALLTAQAAFGLISKTIGSGKDFSGFDTACNWLKGQAQPLVDNYEFVADPGSYAACSLVAVNTGAHTVTFRAASYMVLLYASGQTYGFLVKQTANVVLQQLAVASATNALICFDSSPNGTVRACSVLTFSACNYGILISQSNQTLVDSCLAGANLAGISLFRSPGARVRRSTVSFCNQDGIDVQGSPDVRLDTVVVSNTFSYSIRFDSSVRSRTRFARVNWNSSNAGITWHQSDSARADSCFINCAQIGIDIQSSPGSVIRRCSLAARWADGVSVSNSDRVRIDSSTVFSLAGVPVSFTSSDGCHILASQVFDGSVAVGNYCDRDSVLQCAIQGGGAPPIQASGGSFPRSVGNVFANNLLTEWDNFAVNLTNQDSARFIYNSISGARNAGNNNIYGLQAINATSLVSRDNVIKNNGASGSYACYLTGGSNFLPGGTNYNDLYCPGGQLVSLNGTSYTNLAAWKASPGHPDSSSLSVDPVFKGGSDYSLDSTSPCKKAGAPIPGITTDLFGSPRDASTPSMGAIEWFPTPPGAFSLLAPLDGAANQHPDVRLAWSVSAWADTYLLYLSRDPLLPVVASRRTDTSYLCSGLLRDSTYYWKVVAWRNTGGTRTAGPWRFSVAPTAPDTPFVPEPQPPLGEKHRGIKAGGCMAYLEVGTDAATPMIYMLKGNNTYEFYRYNVLQPGLGWVADAPIPITNRNGKKKAPGKGATLTAAGGKVYASKGNNVLDWWEFTANPTGGLGTWVQKNDVPASGKNVKDGAGAACINLTGQDYVYLLKGNGTMEFYRFNPSDNSWLTLSSAPGGPKGKGYKTGSAIVYYPDDKDGPGVNRHIYFLKGNYNELYSFGVDDGSWTTLETLPRGAAKKKAKDGAGLAYHADTIYAIKGNKTNEFWKYACTGAAWRQGPSVGGSGTVQAGGSILYSDADNSLYIVKGGGTTAFYRYPLGVTRNSGSTGSKAVQSQSAHRGSQFALSITPNPLSQSLNPSISYSLPIPGNVSLKLYDITGKLVSTLVSGYHPAGSYNAGLSAAGCKLSAGVYLLKLESEDCQTTEKLIIQ